MIEIGACSLGKNIKNTIDLWFVSYYNYVFRSWPNMMRLIGGQREGKLDVLPERTLKIFQDDRFW
jgi:hypothetical protein